MNKLKSQIEQVKKMGDLLTSYNYPIKSLNEEIEIYPLKNINLVIDGYEVNCCYNKSRYQTCVMESLQITTCYTPLVPFNIICKLGSMFLGDKELGFNLLTERNKDIYCWISQKDYSGKPVPYPEDKIILTSYEGFIYGVLREERVNLL